VPSKHEPENEYSMKTSILTRAVAALAIGAAFPLGAYAAKPAKMMTERGVIEKVDPARKEFALKGGYLKRTATFEWNASTRFVENGKRAAASELKPGERADVKYAHLGKQRVATRIAISPGGKTAGAHKAHARKVAGPA
jgi:hypothetical protein